MLSPSCYVSCVARLRLYETVFSRLRALPRVANLIREYGKLTCRNVVAVCNHLKHLFVHFDVLVLGKCLFLFPLDEGLLNFILEERGLDCVDYLKLSSRRRDLH